MAVSNIEFYEDGGVCTHVEGAVYGPLISSADVSAATTTPAHATKPGNATYVRVVTDTAMYIEIGNGNQDCGATRRSLVLAGTPFDTALRSTDTTVTYRTVA